jgi:hypothetical protein
MIFTRTNFVDVSNIAHASKAISSFTESGCSGGVAAGSGPVYVKVASVRLPLFPDAQNHACRPEAPIILFLGESEEKRAKAKWPLGGRLGIPPRERPKVITVTHPTAGCTKVSEKTIRVAYRARDPKGWPVVMLRSFDLLKSLPKYRSAIAFTV